MFINLVKYKIKKATFKKFSTILMEYFQSFPTKENIPVLLL